MKKYQGQWDYSQPDFYHFSEDSVLLAKFVCEHYKNIQKTELIFLEPFAGCGVIGIEVMATLGLSDNYHFVEIQKEFEFHLNDNLDSFLPHANKNYMIGDYQLWKEQVDCIVANPPYFVAEHSKPSLSASKNVCRQMTLQDFVSFFDFAYRSLSKGGLMFISFRLDIDFFIQGKFHCLEVREHTGMSLYLLEKTD